MAMNDSGFGSSSFSVATTVFVSLAICAIISYGVFYYFKQRISVIEQSQMEQARILQSFIARSIMHQQQPHQPHQPHQPPQDGNQLFQEHLVHKEVTITESGLIEVSSDSESESSDSESESESVSTSSDSSSDYDNDHDHDNDNDNDHANDHANESSSSEIKHIQIQLLPDDAVIAADDVIDASTVSTKKIISLNKTAIGDNTDEESDDDDGESESDSGSEHPDHSSSLEPFELNIGYKAKTASKLQLNYGNMSVSALRQLAKERSLGGEDGDLQKLKKKDLVQLLTSNPI